MSWGPLSLWPSYRTRTKSAACSAAEASPSYCCTTLGFLVELSIILLLCLLAWEIGRLEDLGSKGEWGLAWRPRSIMDSLWVQLLSLVMTVLKDLCRRVMMLLASGWCQYKSRREIAPPYPRWFGVVRQTIQPNDLKKVQHTSAASIDQIGTATG